MKKEYDFSKGERGKSYDPDAHIGLPPHEQKRQGIDTTAGASRTRSRKRRKVLDRLFDLFEGHDAEEEAQTLKQQDEGF